MSLVRLLSRHTQSPRFRPQHPHKLEEKQKRDKRVNVPYSRFLLLAKCHESESQDSVATKELRTVGIDTLRHILLIVAQELKEGSRGLDQTQAVLVQGLGSLRCCTQKPCLPPEVPALPQGPGLGTQSSQARRICTWGKRAGVVAFSCRCWCVILKSRHHLWESLETRLDE